MANLTPNFIFKMADKLKIVRDKCLVFEDSDSGIQSGLDGQYEGDCCK